MSTAGAARALVPAHRAVSAHARDEPQTPGGDAGELPRAVEPHVDAVRAATHDLSAPEQPGGQCPVLGVHPDLLDLAVVEEVNPVRIEPRVGGGGLGRHGGYHLVESIRAIQARHGGPAQP